MRKRCTKLCPVSYTHLDVYKRQHIPTLQDFRAELLQQDEPEAKELALAIEPVSYTHLDVYKRQLL